MSEETLLQEVRSTLRTIPWAGQSYRKIWPELRHRGARTAPRRVLWLMRDASLLASARVGRARGSRARDGTIIPEAPDRRWGTDAASAMAGEGRATFILVDHFAGECFGIHAACVETRFEALEPLRQAVSAVFGSYRSAVAAEAGLERRHDHGSQYTSDVFQDELTFIGIASSASCVWAPEDSGLAERLIRTRKEQLLWLEHFESLPRALHEFRERYRQTWIMHRHGFRTPAQIRAKHASAAPGGRGVDRRPPSHCLRPRRPARRSRPDVAGEDLTTCVSAARSNTQLYGQGGARLPRSKSTKYEETFLTTSAD